MKKKNIFLFFLILSPIILCAQSKINVSQISNQYIEYTISVVGNVINPGTYLLQPTQRVSDAIKIANSIASDSLTIEQQEILNNSSTRNIIVKRNSKSIHVDLERFLRCGDEKHNPYVNDGDVIFVPAIEKRVNIYGAINRDGEYELVKGDKLLDIILIAMGLSDDAYLQEAEIIRFKNNKSEIETIKINLHNLVENHDSSDNVVLKNDDRIYIRSIPYFHRKESIMIHGEVEFPGIYAIEEGITTLYDILVQGGGPTKDSDLQNAFLQRRARDHITDPEFERLKKMLIEDMTSLEYEYFKTKSRELNGKFSTDFEKLWFEKNMNYNFKLKTGDYIYIPDKTVTVKVSGQVKNPGLTTFVEGKNYLYYINRAGGFAWRARKGKVRLIKANTGEWLKPDEDTPVEVGDMIFIPEKPEIEFWDLFKDIIRVTAEIATVVIVIQNVTR